MKPRREAFQIRWQRKPHIFLLDLGFFEFVITFRLQVADELLNQVLGRGGSGRNCDSVDVLKHLGLHFTTIIKQIRRHASFFANLNQPPRIRTVLRTHDQQSLAKRSYRFDG